MDAWVLVLTITIFLLGVGVGDVTGRRSTRPLKDRWPQCLLYVSMAAMLALELQPRPPLAIPTLIAVGGVWAALVWSFVARVRAPDEPPHARPTPHPQREP